MKGPQVLLSWLLTMNIGVLQMKYSVSEILMKLFFVLFRIVPCIAGFISSFEVAFVKF